MTIAIIFHSSMGHTKALAHAIADGVGSLNKESPAIVEINQNIKIDWQTLQDAKAIIFGSPTFMGSVSAPFKAFMDQTGNFWLKQPWKNKIAAGFTISTAYSGDKLNTLSTMMIFAMQHGMIWIGQNHIGSIHTKDNKNINEAGSWIGLMAQSNTDKIKLIYDGDRETAKLFGQRVAEITTKINS